MQDLRDWPLEKFIYLAFPPGRCSRPHLRKKV